MRTPITEQNSRWDTTWTLNCWHIRLQNSSSRFPRPWRGATDICPQIHSLLSKRMVGGQLSILGVAPCSIPKTCSSHQFSAYSPEFPTLAEEVLSVNVQHTDVCARTRVHVSVSWKSLEQVNDHQGLLLSCPLLKTVVEWPMKYELGENQNGLGKHGGCPDGFLFNQV